MDILNDLYVATAKNKHLIPQAFLLLIGLVVKKEKIAKPDENLNYLGDNVPLNLVSRIKNT